VNQPSEIAGYVRQNPSVRVEVDGSTDLLRGTPYSTVRDALVRAGVSADMIETGTFAAERASGNNSIERCAQRDGLVEVLVRSKRSTMRGES
jgi:outer membrane protein OmpA-like peptidoglycan-associated protein